MHKIMVVDDEEGIRRLVSITLNIGDYEIFQASSGDEAVVLAELEVPDVILMDIDMPGSFDGLEATRRIRDNPRTKQCKIIMLTSHDFDADKQRALECGADDYFIKPFSPLQLLDKIESLLPPDLE